jgi:hypothetical protein
MGSWVLYGLGAENQDLPGFVFMGGAPNGGVQNYASAFLPASYQATSLRKGERMDNLANGNPEAQRRELDLIRSMDQKMLQRQQTNPELEGVIHSFELGFRMQSAVPRVLDFSSESKQTLDLYGIGKGAADEFGRQCLVARRFAEAGARFIEITRGQWDHHQSVSRGLTENCLAIDQPIAALLTDLKQRGLLQDTLVLWGGEFGRTPGKDRGTDGRGHNGTGYTMWLAGGGVKGGLRFGATDEYSAEAVENKVHVHDLHATLLHLLGLDHQKLTYRYSGRDYSLTDVHDARVVKEILA